MESNLYRCPDCGNGVSGAAEACPGCGRPMRAEARERTLRGWKVVEGAALPCVLVGALFALNADSGWDFFPAALGVTGWCSARVAAWWVRGG